MGIGWLILIFFGGIVIFFFLLGKFTPGSGADLVDWDPTRRQEAKLAMEDEDAADLLEITNRRRRANGLPELSHDDVLSALARQRKSGDL